LALAGAAQADQVTETYTSTPNLFIPDAGGLEYGPEVSTSIVVPLPRETMGVEVYFALDHQYSSDLRMWVESPQGTRIRLFLIGNGGEPNINPAGWYPADFTPSEDMGQWIGEPMEGTWTMIWQDLSQGETGTLTEWRLRLTYDSDVADEGSPWSDIKALFRE
jgi:subtilisin-like proprotein convertase family protein